MNKVTVSLVTYNGDRFVSDCLKSLLNQNFQDFELIVVDNGSTDETLRLVRGVTSQAKIIENPTNLGFAKAHNQAIRAATGEYVFVLNQDIILQPNFLKELVKVLDEKPQVGSAGGKLKRAHSPDHLDTTGLIIKKNRQVIDRGADEVDRGQYDQAEEVFGISGAAVLYRREALNAVAHQGQYFDEDFFCYKEDVDLAWRLQEAGYNAYYQPTAKGLHFRGSGQTSQDLKNQISFWRKKSDFLVYHSYKNHLFTLLKNEELGHFLRYFPFIIGHELKKLVALTIFKPQLLKVVPEVLSRAPKMLRKRAIKTVHHTQLAKFI
ncbi:glycosyltransferase family 2 protein [Candidatus Uhrbacteria bacterium]|nr:glycosyltransferase family 2 protein [Candidatus Uhrbacteria bacterium]